MSDWEADDFEPTAHVANKAATLRIDKKNGPLSEKEKVNLQEESDANLVMDLFGLPSENQEIDVPIKVKKVESNKQKNKKIAKQLMKRQKTTEKAAMKELYKDYVSDEFEDYDKSIDADTLRRSADRPRR